MNRINASRPMHSGTTSVVQPQEMNFTIPQDLAQSGIPAPQSGVPGTNPAVPAQQLQDLSNPYSQTT